MKTTITTVDEKTIRQRVEKHFEDRRELLVHASIYVVVNLALWVVWLVTGLATGVMVWPLVVMLGWGAGLAGHALDVFARLPWRLAAADRQVFQQMENLYGPDWREVASEDDYRKLHEAAHQTLNQRKEFYIHMAVYLLVNLAVLALWSQWGGRTGGFPLPLALLFLWGLGLAGHCITVFSSPARMVAARERAIQQAVERETQRLYGDAPHKEKRKHERLMLSEDGELLEVDEDDWQAEIKRNH